MTDRHEEAIDEMLKRHGIYDTVIAMFEAKNMEIERLREALSAMTELFKATEASAQFALSEVERLRAALKPYSCLCDDDSDLFNCPYDKKNIRECGWQARSVLENLV